MGEGVIEQRGEVVLEVVEGGSGKLWVGLRGAGWGLVSGAGRVRKGREENELGICAWSEWTGEGGD